MKQTIVTLVDDLDPTGETPADETVQFALDGIHYEIDLTGENAEALRARLKTYTQGGRVIKGTTARGGQPMTRPADSSGATYSRHQGGVDPKAARAWAIKQSLLVPPRGRLPKEIKDAFSAFTKFGDRAPLDKLVKAQGGRLDAPIPLQDEEDPGAPEFAVSQPVVREAVRAAEEKAAQAPRRPMSVTRAGRGEEPAGTEDDTSAEEAARNHYEPLTVHDRITGSLDESASWKNRTADGNDRVLKVAQWTLVERIEALKPFNLRVLGDLIADRRNKEGNVSGLKTSAARLQNLEMIEHAPGTKDGWRLTKFGRYAYEVRSSQTA
ncbi:histone-like nucleoid-structuring protein Lsr2 [Streptomyces drozdowiczii]